MHAKFVLPAIPVLLAMALAPFAATADSIAADLDESAQNWFVELSSQPTAAGGSAAAVRSEKQKFRSEAAKAGLQFQERYAFDTLWNGLSVRIDKSQLAKLTRIPGVKAIYPVIAGTLDPGPADEADLATALAMTGADIAQSSLGMTGAGIRVAVMDTGIDYDHPDLGGCFGPGCRVETGWDFVGDFYTGPDGPVAPAPDPDPDDCNGHGSHVAGIVGASGAVVGVAPDVTFGAYRVFGCDGSTSADIMIAAMERALADDMDVLNMSIGSAFQWPQYPTATASDNLVNKGVVVVASIGNSGASGLYSAGAPGLGKKVIGVASFDNSHVSLSTFTVTPANITAGYGNAAAAPPAPTSGSLPLARTGTPTTANDGCSALPAGSLAGRAVLIRRGTCTFHSKALNAQNAGAAAVVLYNNAAGRFSPTVAGTPAIVIPVVAVSDTEGVAINNAIASGPQTLNWQSTQGTFVNPTGGLISSFSSYGLSPDLALKPDIGAPGGLIRSTYPLELGGYATISGTSMSSPHVAGAAALVLQAHPNTSSQAMRRILQNSADPARWFGSPAFVENVHRQGAGMVDIDDAILATTRIEPGKLSLGEGEFGPIAQTLTVENKGASPVTYNLSFVNAVSTGGVITPSFFLSDASVAFSAPSVTVPAGGTASVGVTVTPATGPIFGQYGGYIVFTPQGGGQVYRVPYAGFVGDYQGITVLTPTANGFPWLATLSGGSFFNQSGGATYSMVGGDVPYILVHVDHQPRKLRMEVFHAVSGKAWHRALQLDYFSRNSTPTSFFAFPWDGVTVNGNKVNVVPNGSYVIKLSVQKALGDDSNPAHWESWTSPVITIARP